MEKLPPYMTDPCEWFLTAKQYMDRACPMPDGVPLHTMSHADLPEGDPLRTLGDEVPGIEARIAIKKLIRAMKVVADPLICDPNDWSITTDELKFPFDKSIVS